MAEKKICQICLVNDRVNMCTSISFLLANSLLSNGVFDVCAECLNIFSLKVVGFACYHKTSFILSILNNFNLCSFGPNSYLPTDLKLNHTIGYKGSSVTPGTHESSGLHHYIPQTIPRPFLLWCTSVWFVAEQKVSVNTLQFTTCWLTLGPTQSFVHKSGAETLKDWTAL